MGNGAIHRRGPPSGCRRGRERGRPLTTSAKERHVAEKLHFDMELLSHTNKTGQMSVDGPKFPPHRPLLSEFVCRGRAFRRADKFRSDRLRTADADCVRTPSTPRRASRAVQAATTSALSMRTGGTIAGEKCGGGPENRPGSAGFAVHPGPRQPLNAATRKAHKRIVERVLRPAAAADANTDPGRRQTSARTGGVRTRQASALRPLPIRIPSPFRTLQPDCKHCEQPTNQMIVLIIGT